MTENSSKILNTPRNPVAIQVEEQSKNISDKNNPKQSGYSIASTEIHSNKKLSLEENMTPKKSPNPSWKRLKHFVV